MSEAVSPFCPHCADGAAKAGRDECLSCGARVCAEHYRALYGLCKACATDERLAKLKEQPPRPHPRDALGIKWVED